MVAAGVLATAGAPPDSLPGLVDETFEYLGDLDGLSRNERNAIRTQGITEG